MKRFKKLALTVGALAALAVGGAAFAQAQNATVATQALAAESDGPGGHHDEPSNSGANNESGADD